MGKNMRGENAGDERNNDKNDGGNFSGAGSGFSEEKIRQYQGKSESELMSELIKNVQNSKRGGTFDPAALEAFYQNAGPSLTAEQRKKLRNLIDMIK
ncbi:MAG: hypothetical protein FWE62_04855 [Firmicutes bacterium]|nr:hypothetical protein [Bacillota bacterium]